MNLIHRFPVTEEEAVKLIHHTIGGEHVQFAFGPGWMGLEWEEGTEMSEALKYLLLIRGVTNENTEGAGI